MSDINELLKACYIQDVETEYVGKIESLSTAGDNIISNDCSCVVRGAFVTDDGNIVKKTLHSSTVKIINQEIFEESIESIMALLMLSFISCINSVMVLMKMSVQKRMKYIASMQIVIFVIFLIGGRRSLNH